MSNRDADPPTSETPSGVWPPAPSAAHHVTEHDGAKDGTQLSTLTPHAWLDLVLGLPTGFVGAFLSFAAVGLVGDLVSPPPESGAKMRLERGPALPMPVPFSYPGRLT